MERASNTLQDDLLVGAAAIAAYTGRSLRQTYYAAERAYLPIGRIGKTLIARKSEIDRATSSSVEAA